MDLARRQQFALLAGADAHACRAADAHGRSLLHVALSAVDGDPADLAAFAHAVSRCGIARDAQQRTPLHVAAARGQWGALLVMARFACSDRVALAANVVNAQDGDGNTFLHVACANECAGALAGDWRAWRDVGAHIMGELRNHAGQPAAFVALANARPEALAWLQQCMPVCFMTRDAAGNRADQMASDDQLPTVLHAVRALLLDYIGDALPLSDTMAAACVQAAATHGAFDALLLHAWGAHNTFVSACERVAALVRATVLPYVKRTARARVAPPLLRAMLVDALEQLPLDTAVQLAAWESSDGYSGRQSIADQRAAKHDAFVDALDHTLAYYVELAQALVGGAQRGTGPDAADKMAALLRDMGAASPAPAAAAALGAASVAARFVAWLGHGKEQAQAQRMLDTFAGGSAAAASVRRREMRAVAAYLARRFATQLRVLTLSLVPVADAGGRGIAWRAKTQPGDGVAALAHVMADRIIAAVLEGDFDGGGVLRHAARRLLQPVSAADGDATDFEGSAYLTLQSRCLRAVLRKDDVGRHVALEGALPHWEAGPLLNRVGLRARRSDAAAPGDGPPWWRLWIVRDAAAGPGLPPRRLDCHDRYGFADVDADEVAWLGAEGLLGAYVEVADEDSVAVWRQRPAITGDGVVC